MTNISDWFNLAPNAARMSLSCPLKDAQKIADALEVLATLEPDKSKSALIWSAVLEKAESIPVLSNLENRTPD